MALGFLILQGLTGLAFVGYGLACLRSPHMVAEFARLGLDRYRRVTGWLEVAGGAGLLLGLWLPPLARLAAGGLALLMALGIGARWRAGDGAREALPAAVFLVVNVVLALALL